MRKDKAKSLAKVAESRLKDPLKTVREVEDEIWLDHSTVSRRDKELQQSATKDDRILWICENDLEIVKLWQQIIRTRLNQLAKHVQDPSIPVQEKISAKDVSTIIRENTARYAIFKGDVTDKDWWLKEISDINISIDG